MYIRVVSYQQRNKEENVRVCVYNLALLVLLLLFFLECVCFHSSLIAGIKNIFLPV